MPPRFHPCPRRSWPLVVALSAMASGAARVHAQADACAGATPIQAGVYSGDTTTLEPDGSSLCQATSRDAWFKYVGGPNPPLVEITTCGSALDTVVSLHSGCPGVNNNELNCNDDGGVCGNGSRLRFLPQPGETVYIRVGGAGNNFGAFVLNVAELRGPADVYIGSMSECEQVGRLGDEVAIISDSPICNAGAEPIDWYAPPIAQAPKVVFNTYRLKDDRLVQIGASWAKHTFGTTQDDWCGFSCAPYPTVQRMGPGCSDTYDVDINQRQFMYTPRSEVNAWTGEFRYEGSYLEEPIPAMDDVERLNRVRDQDLDPAQNPGAIYFIECAGYAHDDADHLNTLAHRRFSVTGGEPGETWTFELSGLSFVGPVTQNWPGASSVTIPQFPSEDGRCVLAAKTRPLGGGMYRYEYAVYNLDAQRGVRSFAIPVGTGATITNIGFHSPTQHGEPGHNDAWQSTRVGPLLVWSTNAYEPSLSSNPLRWGTLYNFWFDAPAAPVSDFVRLTPYRPGTATIESGLSIAPYQLCPADLDDGTGSGTPDDAVDISDLLQYLVLFENGSTQADLDDGSGTGHRDGGVEISDLIYFLVHFEGGC